MTMLSLKAGPMYRRRWLHVVFFCAFAATAAYFLVAAALAYAENTAPLTEVEQIWASLQISPRPVGRRPILTGLTMTLISGALACRCLNRRSQAGAGVGVGNLVNRRHARCAILAAGSAIVVVGCAYIRAAYHPFVLEGASGLVDLGFLFVLFLISFSRIFEFDDAP